MFCRYDPQSPGRPPNAYENKYASTRVHYEDVIDKCTYIYIYVVQVLVIILYDQEVTIRRSCYVN